MKTICDWCKKEFQRKPSQINKHKRHFCNINCMGQWMLENCKGENALHWKGGDITSICKFCGKEFKHIISSNRKFCCMDCYNKSGKNAKGRIWKPESRIKLSNSVTGINNNMYGKIGEFNPAWKGGIAKHNQMERISKEIKRWKRTIYRRDDYTCQICKKRGGTLNSHHIIPFADFPEERLNLDNGVTLCLDCHKSIHFR